MKGFMDGPTNGPLSEAEEAMNAALGEPDDGLTDAAADGETENALLASRDDLDRHRRQCIGIYLGLEQDKIWVDAQGVVHQIEEMSVRYKVNCLAFRAGAQPW